MTRMHGVDDPVSIAKFLFLHRTIIPAPLIKMIMNVITTPSPNKIEDLSRMTLMAQCKNGYISLKVVRILSVTLHNTCIIHGLFHVAAT